MLASEWLLVFSCLSEISYLIFWTQTVWTLWHNVHTFTFPSVLTKDTHHWFIIVFHLSGHLCLTFLSTYCHPGMDTLSLWPFSCCFMSIHLIHLKNELKTNTSIQNTWKIQYDTNICRSVSNCGILCLKAPPSVCIFCTCLSLRDNKTPEFYSSFSSCDKDKNYFSSLWQMTWDSCCSIDAWMPPESGRKVLKSNTWIDM